MSVRAKVPRDGWVGRMLGRGLAAVRTLVCPGFGCGLRCCESRANSASRDVWVGRVLGRAPASVRAPGFSALGCVRGRCESRGGRAKSVFRADADFV